MHSFLKKGKTKKPLHRHQESAGARSRFKMMFYVTALKFKGGTVIAPNHSLTVPKRIEWWVTVFSLSIPPALGGFRHISILHRIQLYPLIQGDFIIP